MSVLASTSIRLLSTSLTPASTVLRPAPRPIPYFEKVGRRRSASIAMTRRSSAASARAVPSVTLVLPSLGPG